MMIEDGKRDVRIGDTFLRGPFLQRVTGFRPYDGEALTTAVQYSGARPAPTLATPPGRDETGRVRAVQA